LEHLLFHLPHRYQNKTSFGQLNQARIGDEILVQLTIERIEAPPSSTRTKTRQLLCYLIDENNRRLLLRFFHFNQYQKQRLVRGDIIQCFGEIRCFVLVSMG
jgi:ATP-dependent DNA helicase RecG